MLMICYNFDTTLVEYFERWHITLARKPKNEKNTQKTKKSAKNPKNKSQVKRAKQKHDPLKWENKKGKKKASQQKKWDVQYSKTNTNCPLPLSIFPSPKRCSGCTLPCKYNPN